MEESHMKLRIAVTAVLCISVCFSLSILENQAYAQSRNAAAANKITVLSPMGTPPPIQLKPQAQRLDTLDGKTIYFVNTGYIGTDRLMAVMSDWFKANYPKTNIVIKQSAGGMTGVDKNLWAEIAEKGDAVIVGLGIEAFVRQGRFASQSISNPQSRNLQCLSSFTILKNRKQR